MLHLAPGLGPGSCLRLVEHFGCPGKVLEADAAELGRVSGLRRDAFNTLVMLDHKAIAEKAKDEVRKARENGSYIITLDDNEYPSMLRMIHQPPLVLYVKGSIEVLHSPSLGVVGSRAATSYGKGVAGQMAYNLVRQGITVVSGLALGVDAEAHRGAINGGGKTIGVLGCGLDIVYPQGNKKLFEKIPGTGAIISEYPFGSKPDAFRFPARNRIISGLSMGVLIVEASGRSGSLITANHALEQGREVFAIPGRVDSVKSAGTHRLLQQGAKLVHSINDIMEELPNDMLPVSNFINNEKARKDKKALPTIKLSSTEETLYSCLEIYPANIDEIIHCTNLPAQKVNELLLLLELKGLVEALPGKCFKRI